jgi:hypothetical protein
VQEEEEAQPSSSTRVAPPTQQDDQDFGRALGDDQEQHQGRDQPIGGSHVDHVSDEDGPIQREDNIPHPRVNQRVQRDHPVDKILRSIRRGVTTHSRLATFCEFYSFVSSLEPLKVEQALEDPDWVLAMKEELNNFKRNEVWSSVERPKQNVIGTK